MSSPEGINYHKEQDIKTSLRNAKFVLNEYYGLGAISFAFMGLSSIRFSLAKGDLFQSEITLPAGLVGLAVSTYSIINIRQKIRVMNGLKAQEERFYHSLSRHNSDVNPQS